YGSFIVPCKSGLLSALFSMRRRPPPAGEEGEGNSGIFPKGLPVPLPVQRMARYVDTTEVMRAPPTCRGR
ncbi:Os05g0447660, partial [Oryza sativa Japonica Group]